MRGGKFKGDVRCKFFYTESGKWNVLPGVVLDTNRIGLFEGLLDRHMNMQEIEGHRPRAGRRD